MKYEPHFWTMVKVKNDGETFYKIFGSWSGGYLDGDYWRLNSGIIRVESEGDKFKFFGASGSVYEVKKDAYGSTGYGYSVLSSARDSHKNNFVPLTEEEALKVINREEF